MSTEYTNSNTKRIAKNTIFLYIRSVLTMAISIYTSRVILQALGVSDYGIYNAVGGFVGMFSILTYSLINASQRFISFEMGKQKPDLHKVFCCTVSIHLLLALVLFLILETIGLWFFYNYLNIPPDRLDVASWVFQCSIISFCVYLFSVPYNASIIAHEDMGAFAYIGIFEVVAKLVIVYLLWLIAFDKLIVYAVLILLLSFILRFINGIYCRLKYKECRFTFLIDRSLLKEIMVFSGWNFFGSISGILSTQGLNILVNLFFGVTLNAARGITEQVNNAIFQFVNNISTALNPQITKSYASGQYEYMNTLMTRGAKYCALLYWLISLTIFIESDYILSIWLIEVPPLTSIFLKLALIYSIFQALASPLYVGMLATGNIKTYQIVMGTLGFLTFVICYIAYEFGLAPEWCYISSIITVFIMTFVRLLLLKRMIPGFSPRYFISNAIVKCFSVIITSTSLVYILYLQLKSYEILCVFSVFISSICLVGILSYIIAFDNKEKDIAKVQISKLILRRKKYGKPSF